MVGEHRGVARGQEQVHNDADVELGSCVAHDQWPDTAHVFQVVAIWATEEVRLLRPAHSALPTPGRTVEHLESFRND